MVVPRVGARVCAHADPESGLASGANLRIAPTPPSGLDMPRSRERALSSIPLRRPFGPSYPFVGRETLTDCAARPRAVSRRASNPGLFHRSRCLHGYKALSTAALLPCFERR